MEHLRGLGHVLLVSLLSLAGYALIAYIAMVATAAWSEWPSVNWPVALFIPSMVVLLGLIIGLPVVVVLVAPAYALLLRAGRASFPAAAAIGAAPGLAMLLLTRELAVPALVTGLAVGLTTHWVCRVRPNNSFKPTPHRGSSHVRTLR